MMRPTISVQMTVFNSLPYLSEAVESILDQSFGDFEFIIIDDGSTDGSGDLLEKYAAKDGRIRLVRRENRGIGASRNEAISLARGEYLAVMDSDDISLPNRFELQVAYLGEHPEVSCVGGASLLVDARGSVLTRHDQPLTNAELQELALTGRVPACASSMMVRRQSAVSVGGYDEGMAPAEDLDLWLKLGECGLLANLPDVILKYREHSKSASAQSQRLQLERCRKAVIWACDRRGIPHREIHLEPLRQGDDPRSQHQFAMRNAWWSFNSGRRGTAFRYAALAIRCAPGRLNGWKLLACVLVKPMRTTS